MVKQERQAAHMLVEHQVVQGVEEQVALEKGAPAEVGVCIEEFTWRGSQICRTVVTGMRNLAAPRC